MQCLNCQSEIHGNYCANCGQRTSTRRITLRTIFENVLAGISNLNRGFFYNVKMLSLHPGPSMMGYLEGKRVSMYHPVQYAIIAVTILTYIDVQYGSAISLSETSASVKETISYSFGHRYGTFLRENLKYMWLLTIVAFSWPASWFFSRLNFAEHLTVQAFICGHSALIMLILYGLYPKGFIFNPIIYVSIWTLMFLAYRQRHGNWPAILFSLVVMIIGLLLFVLVPAFFLWLLDL